MVGFELEHLEEFGFVLPAVFSLAKLDTIHELVYTSLCSVKKGGGGWTNLVLPQKAKTFSKRAEML